MKTYNKEAVDAAKRLSNLSKNKLFEYSKLAAKLSTIFIFVGGTLLVLKREIIGGGVVIFGIVSLLTSGFNVFRTKDN